MEKVMCLVLVLFTSSCAADEDYPVVTTTLGRLRGSVLTSRLGRPIYSFRGVRFAQPPVGNLRFKAPMPMEPWDDIVNATEDGASCPPLEGGRSFYKHEDCLFMNVYTPKLPRDEENSKTSVHNSKKPVIVFFHPGGWASFTGNSRMFGPQYLLDQDVVLVVPNYRLGALGFLSTQDEVLPGNYAMKDQVAVLRWVRDNIAAFGGDPNSVTIAGYSAGSRSVMLHMVSPMSRGLFHRVIASSGSALSPSTIQENPVSRAKKQAQMFGCPFETSHQIMSCLQLKDAQELARRPARLRSWGFEPMINYAPVIEPETGEERFLVRDPIEDFISGNFAQVPLFTGMNKDEFAWKIIQVFANETWAEDMNENFDTVAPIVFMYEKDTPRSLYISRELRRLYFQDRPIDNNTADELGKLYRDGIVGFAEDRASKVISGSSSKPVYYYRFSYQGRYSYIYKPGTRIPFGVSHHDDLICLFYTPVLFPFFNSTDPEVQCVEKLTTLWANFAKTGNPTPKQDEVLQNITWEPFTRENLKYLDIGSELEMKSGLYQDTLEVWERLFPLPTHGRKA